MRPNAGSSARPRTRRFRSAEIRSPRIADVSARSQAGKARSRLIPGIGVGKQQPGGTRGVRAVNGRSVCRASRAKAAARGELPPASRARSAVRSVEWCPRHIPGNGRAADGAGDRRSRCVPGCGEVSARLAPSTAAPAGPDSGCATRCEQHDQAAVTAARNAGSRHLFIVDLSHRPGKGALHIACHAPVHHRARFDHRAPSGTARFAFNASRCRRQGASSCAGRAKVLRAPPR